MKVKSVPMKLINVSKYNARKDLQDGQTDSSLEDFASSIERKGLLSPIIVRASKGGRYEIVAGQRRFLACQILGWAEIPAIVRSGLSDADATAISLIENVHRADMNPRDKADAFDALLSELGSISAVASETGFTNATIGKYLKLLKLSPELQDRLAAGETKNTDALAKLASRFHDSDDQIEVWSQIEGFTQPVQKEILRKVDDDRTNLGSLVELAAEGALGINMVKNCPYDCPTIPDSLKDAVATIIRS